MIGHIRLRELLDYDPESGLFTWAVSHGFKKRGTKTSRDRITLEGKVYQAGRLVWFYNYGHWPGKNFRYLDGDRTNTRLANLARSKAPKPVKQVPDVWVRIGAASDGYKVELAQKYQTLVNLGTYATYAEAAEVQRRVLECSS